MKARSRSRTPFLASTFSAALLSAVAGAQAPEEKFPPAAASAEELAKKLSNPIADLVSIPFQLNWSSADAPLNKSQIYGVGPDFTTLQGALTVRYFWQFGGKFSTQGQGLYVQFAMPL